MKSSAKEDQLWELHIFGGLFNMVAVLSKGGLCDVLLFGTKLHREMDKLKASNDIFRTRE